MSLTLTLSGKSSVLAANYSPAIDLADDYELGLALFETYHTIPNVTAENNKFYFDDDDREITIPTGSYEVRDINEFLRRAIANRRNVRAILDELEASSSSVTDNVLTIRVNHNTMKCEIWGARAISFSKPNSIGSLLGFSSTRWLEPRKWHESDASIDIMSANIIRVECSVTAGAYSNEARAHDTRILAECAAGI